MLEFGTKKKKCVTEVAVEAQHDVKDVGLRPTAGTLGLSQFQTRLEDMELRQPAQQKLGWLEIV